MLNVLRNWRKNCTAERAWIQDIVIKTWIQFLVICDRFCTVFANFCAGESKYTELTFIHLLLIPFQVCSCRKEKFSILFLVNPVLLLSSSWRTWCRSHITVWHRFFSSSFYFSSLSIFNWDCILSRIPLSWNCKTLFPSAKTITCGIVQCFSSSAALVPIWPVMLTGLTGICRVARQRNCNLSPLLNHEHNILCLHNKLF